MRHVVTRPVRLGLVETLRRDGRTREFRLRAGSQPVLLRSGERAFDVLEEICRYGEYDPIPPVEPLLASRSPLHVVDLGGNVGLFAARMFQSYADCTVA